MAKKHEMIRRCAQVRDLIQENKYVQAMEIIDELPLDEVAALEDLYLFADIYERAARLDRKKEIFFVIYERTHSRYILNRLLRLVIRMGNMEEARELFLAYEFAGKVTLETFELRYLLAKAEGESRKTLITILEELKREEYTEQWGYQLARLYEMEGMRKECIQECRDLKLWFGEGQIVDKAMELMRRCEAPGWKPPKDEEIPEPEIPDMEERMAYAAPLADVGEPDRNPAMDTEPEPERRKKPRWGWKQKREPEPEMEPEQDPESEMVSEVMPTAVRMAMMEAKGITADREEPEEDTGVIAEEPEEYTRAIEEVKDPEEDTRVIEEVQEPEEDTRTIAKAEEPEEDAWGADEEDETAEYTGDYVSQPVVVRKGNSEKSPKSVPMPIPDEDLEEDPEDISARGVSYRTLKSTIAHMRRSEEPAHFVFAGGEERIVLAVAKRIAKELHRTGYLAAQKIAKITASKLNELELSEQMEKLAGGCMLVTSASELTEKAVADLLSVMQQNSGRIVVMLSGPFDEVDCFLSIYTDLSKALTYKIHM